MNDRQLSRLVEATYAADEAVRAEANRAWDDFVRYIKIMVKAGRTDEFSRHNPTRGFAFTGTLGIPTGMGVILAPKDVQSGIGNLRGLVVIVLGDALLGPFSTEHLDTRVERLRRQFIHEYTHNLDQKRRKSPGTNRAAKKFADEGKWDSYIRTPEEFNAWYQETAHRLEDDTIGLLKSAEKQTNPVIANMLRKSALDRMASFSEFKREADRVAKDVVDAILGTKWERKWDKRLHGLYVGLKQRADEMADRT